MPITIKHLHPAHDPMGNAIELSNDSGDRVTLHCFDQEFRNNLITQLMAALEYFSIAQKGGD